MVKQKDHSHGAGVVKLAETWMTQILYPPGAHPSRECQLCKLLGLQGHLDREHQVTLQHRQLSEMQPGKRCFFTAAELARGNRRE